MRIREDRRATMTENRNLSRLSRRARTILAVDSLMMASDDDPARITRQDIAARAMEWTTDRVTAFADEDVPCDDYYSIINDLMGIVSMMRRGDG
jgi:hypothetical protein